MKPLNFDDYKFRASQSYYITTGTIGVTIEQEKRIDELINERDTGINANGNKCKWTEPKKAELEKLLNAKENPEIPKGMQTELRKIFRSEKYNRKFLFHNKYTKKGVSLEEESFTVYQKWLEKVKGVKTFLKNNKERLENDFFSGETDSYKEFHKKFDYGFDIKTSWSLETFAYEEDDLDLIYEWQNRVYMELTGMKKWKTVYVLVNSTESILHNAKMGLFYFHDMDKSDLNEEQFNKECKNLERLHIVDYDRFIHVYPGHDLLISREEWMQNNWDIPLEDRVVEKTVLHNDEKIEFLKDRVEISRKYLNELSKK